MHVLVWNLTCQITKTLWPGLDPGCSCFWEDITGIWIWEDIGRWVLGEAESIVSILWLLVWIFMECGGLASDHWPIIALGLNNAVLGQCCLDSDLAWTIGPGHMSTSANWIQQEDHKWCTFIVPSLILLHQSQSTQSKMNTISRSSLQGTNMYV